MRVPEREPERELCAALRCAALRCKVGMQNCKNMPMYSRARGSCTANSILHTNAKNTYLETTRCGLGASPAVVNILVTPL